ncbi:wd40 repeat protein [Anaeramoeba ignava]|uniref:Wd40 repeat protein n=1 Tax=Anaeramoeba ignava TaxID=1746090 RepID=A0A9Q0LH42_ANAIG|nr:wd40 repeat protein [Anaeramoeba ignava]
MNLNRPETALTSDEVNFLIFKYLQESGMDHSAFVFAQESQVLNSPIVLQGDSGLPKAALVTLIQKGLQYTEIEQSLSKVDLEQEFFEKKRKKKERKDKVSKEEKAKTTSNTKQEPNTNDGESQQEKENTTKNSLTKNTDNPDFGISKTSNDSQKQDTNNLSDPKKNSNIQTNQSQTFSNPNSNFPAKIKFLENDVKILKGHTSEVFVCQWSPNGRFLASGSGDTTARIWDISYLETNNIKLDQIPSKVLKHHNLNTTVSSKDVTTLDWHPQGAFLATGSYDGIARIWREDGEIVSSLVGHKSAIFSLKWNKTGDFLLSGSLDSSVIVWDTKTNSQKQIFRKHTAPTLDVDWRTPI